MSILTPEKDKPRTFCNKISFFCLLTKEYKLLNPTSDISGKSHSGLPVTKTGCETAGLVWITLAYPPAHPLQRGCTQSSFCDSCYHKCFQSKSKQKVVFHSPFPTRERKHQEALGSRPASDSSLFLHKAWLSPEWSKNDETCPT